MPTMMNAMGCVGALFAGYMADKIGRIKSTYVAAILAIGAVIFMVVLGFGGGHMMLACILMGFAVNYLYTTPQPIVIEVYPTEIRATAQACVTTVARIGGLIIPIAIGGLMQDGLSFATILTAFIVPIALTVVFTKYLIRDETAGRRLEQLDD
jgi:MFS family permease